MIHHLKCENVRPTTQCIGETYYQMFICLPLALTYIPSLNRYWSIVWSMTVCWML